MTKLSTETLDLRGYLRPLRSRWWVVVVIALAASALTYAYYVRQPPLYAASTTLLLDPLDVPGVNVDPDRYAREQVFLLGTRKIAARVARELDVEGGPDALPGSVTAAESSGANLIELTARSASQRDAVRLANAYATEFVEYTDETGREEARQARIGAEKRLAQIRKTPQTRAARLQLESSIETLGLQENSTQTTVQQVEPAVFAVDVSDDPKRNAIFAFVLGALIGVGLAYGLEHLDRRVRSVADLAELYDLQLLATVPRVPGAAASPFALCLDPVLKEAFRGLRTTLQLRGTRGVRRTHLRTILVTSAIAGEGKSTVARSIALAYFEAGLRVALVDADLRRPTLAGEFGLQQAPGLADVLGGRPLADALHVVEPVDGNGDGGGSPQSPAGRAQRIAAAFAGAGPRRRPTVVGQRGRAPVVAPGAVSAVSARDAPANGDAAQLSILTGGKAPADPAALLASPDVIGVLVGLQDAHDVVVVDTSPLLPVSDTMSLLNVVDGVLVVSRLGFTTRPAAADLRDVLARVPDVELLGVVANCVEREHGYSPYGYYGQT